MESEKLKEALLRSRKLILLGKLSQGVAHDVNNMLAAIMGNGELIVNQIEAQNPLKEYAENILRACKNSVKIITQMLAFSNRKTMAAVSVNINENIRDLFGLLQAALSKHFEIILDLDTDLHRICIDPLIIDEILLLAIINAREAKMTGGKVTIKTTNITLDEAIGCECQKKISGEDFVELCVMYEEDEKSSLDMFKLLGFYDMIIEANGHIKFHKEQRKRMIQLYFPLYEKVSKTLPKDIGRAGKTVRLKKETVLVIDDEELVIAMAENILEYLGYKVLCAKTKRGVETVLDNYDAPIHLLITDVLIDEGENIIQMFKAKHPKAKILYMSGLTREYYLNKGHLKESDIFLGKPFTLKSLEKTIKGALSD